jgi:glycosyltransferase involved in cell wall biosynthesis
LKVVLVCNSAWGIANFRGNLVRALTRAGVEVVAAAPADGHVETLRTLGARFFPVEIDGRGLSPVKDIVLCWKLASLYQSERPDLVFHYTIKPVIYGSLASRLASVPSLAVITGLGSSFIAGGWLKFVVGMLYRAALRYAREVWFLNNDDEKAFVLSGLVEQAKVHVLPGEGVDLTKFDAPAGVSGDAPMKVLMISRLIKDKGVVEFIEAARLLKAAGVPVLFQLLGPFWDNESGEISRETVMTWQSEGVVEYLGSSDDVRPFIAQADVVALPSYREGVPRTLIEAAAMRRPLIATDVPGCRDVVIDGWNGLVCAPRDASGLADCVHRMAMMSHSERALMGQRGRDLAVQRFDEKIVMERYAEFSSRIGRRLDL